jgi:hypothetical protein
LVCLRATGLTNWQVTAQRQLFTGVNGPASRATAWTDGHAQVLPVLLDGRYPLRPWPPVVQAREVTA